MQTTDEPRSSERPIDWEAIEHSAEFQELVRRKRRFVVPATIFFLAWYLAFILLAGYAEDFMGESIYEGFTVGYALALTQFVMVWVLAWMYLRKADKEFDPLQRAAVDHLHDEVDADTLRRAQGGRFDGSPEAAKPSPKAPTPPTEIQR